MVRRKTAIVVLVTTPSEEEAARIGRALVEDRLAACGNIVPRLRSIYRWEGKVLDEPEALLLLKTTPAGFRKLERQVKKLHSYKTPEIIALPVHYGSAEYLGWIHAETSKTLKKKPK